MNNDILINSPSHQLREFTAMILSSNEIYGTNEPFINLTLNTLVLGHTPSKILFFDASNYHRLRVCSKEFVQFHVSISLIVRSAMTLK